MKKIPHCTKCGQDNHYAINCRKYSVLAAKQTTKMIKGYKPKKVAKRRSYYVKQLDSIFSTFIRLRDKDNGCFTCGSKASYREQQNGHFYSRAKIPTRWDEDNCKMQCVHCNVFMKGNYIIYTKKMIDLYGRDFVDKLEQKSLSCAKITTQQIKEMIDYYRGVVENMSK